MGSCGGCQASWTGVRAAHCGAAGCHRTFAAPGLFDEHRHHRGEHGGCVDPVGLEGMELRDGMWRGPEMDDVTKAKAFGRH